MIQLVTTQEYFLCDERINQKLVRKIYTNVNVENPFYHGFTEELGDQLVTYFSFNKQREKLVMDVFDPDKN